MYPDQPNLGVDKPVLSTIVFIISQDGKSVLLGKKKRGFATGIINGFGGKKHPDETMAACAIRELEEESGITMAESDLTYCGMIRAVFQRPTTNWTMEIALFRGIFQGQDPIESEEMAPSWYRIDSLPFQDMWDDDPSWLPGVLHGGFVMGDFLYVDKVNRVIESVIEHHNPSACSRCIAQESGHCPLIPREFPTSLRSWIGNGGFFSQS
ncbi:putative Oxidized purine nucleoside triphosphate hydrolase [Blattamonas nauphoetae]|uniref:Oxidized purine nucleoside triphosphate hydrolase n=1 Tax=Blattamonas nauphoetae TaxID=2049346 RepID=A0ABQ9XF22_9EUKA|nr:putative Oxidized purine nucleoside triphosphate hydrolase [Blattamonas nauphoetae]